MHRLVARQLRQCFGETDLDPAVRGFAAAVEATYREYEADYALLERSLDLSSRELVQANTELRAMIEAFPDLFLWLTPDGTIVSFRSRNPKHAPLPPDELIGRRVQSMPARGAQGEFDRALAEIRSGAAGATVDYTLWRHEGERSFEARLLPVGRDRILVAIRDVTDRAEAHRRLLDSEQRYRQLFESNPQPMWVIDLETLRFLAVNESAVRHYGFGREEFLSMTVDQIRPGDEREIARLEIRNGLGHAGTEGSPRRQARHVRKNGSELHVEIVTHGLLFLGRPAMMSLIEDVTERNLLEARLRQSQKMEAVGRLAGGVAHDFNNLLTAMLGFTHLARRRIPESDPAQLDLDQVRRAAERAAALTRQLLAFSRQQVLTPRVMDLNAVVHDMEKLLRRLVSEDIELVTSTAPDLGRITADPSQIEQVLVNLVVNAGDAMPTGGSLAISTTNVTLGPTDLGAHPGLRPGRYARLEVTDTGAGMSPAIQSRIFEPFFTTKGVGRGTGLGLSTVLGIVEQSGGWIEVKSREGQGSTFSVYLPQTALDEVVERESAERNDPLGGAETILVVEDEPLIRRAIGSWLENLGYTVLEVESAAEALDLLGARGREIALMLTDVIMPNMGGPELVERALLSLPHLQYLLMSGYTERALQHSQLPGWEEHFIQKPFTPDGLARRVRELLDSPKARAA